MILKLTYHWLTKGWNTKVKPVSLHIIVDKTAVEEGSGEGGTQRTQTHWIMTRHLGETESTDSNIKPPGTEFIQSRDL